MNKKVWILNHYAQEPNGAGGTRHYSLAQELSAYGWDATVIAASTVHDTGKQRFAMKSLFVVERYGSVPFVWVRTPEYMGNGLARSWNMLAYSAQVLRPKITSQLDRPDLIIGSSVHPFAALSAAVLAWRFRVPFVFEVRDLWPQTLIDMGRIKPQSIAAKVMRLLERALYKRANRIITLLPYAYKYIQPLGVPEDKIMWLPNGADLANYPAVTAPSSKKKFCLMYFGSHGPANGLSNLLEAMRCLKEKGLSDSLYLRMVGDGNQKSELIQTAIQYGLDNVVFEDSIPKNKIPALASQADAFVICVNDLPKLYRYGISMNKIYDYMAAARPVIISTGAVNNPVAEALAGITVPPANPVELANAILQLMEMSPSDRWAMGLAGRSAVETKYTYDKLAMRLADILNNVIEEHNEI